ncbi:peptidoglycan-binding protein [Nocardioides mesophilus]|uniref:Peptidoglycan-binding protein n=1 Tax=Nocardioides mesophilus TaxID=433659 RepID=A0A7G9RFR2_9ACTN|nr:peptidoglycan-binding protein [Nocardioides mesophilus]QNN54437.1 peptidoglycan-binding protein [Nocardioides mesophilus]
MAEPRPVFRRGDRGPAVVDIRSRLLRLGLLGEPAAAEPELFDEHLDRAVRDFQQQRGLSVDGRVGPTTYRVLDEARWRLGDRLLTFVPAAVLSGDDVVALQQRLLDLGFQVGRIDGSFGHRTELAVREFQRNVGVPSDGTCGPATLKALARLAPLVKGGRPNALRTAERLRTAGPQLTGKVVVIDPCPTNAAETDPALAELAEEVIGDLAKRVEGRLVATGVQAFLTKAHGAEAASEADRADFANRTDAHLVISLQVDASANPDACGCSTYFFGLDSHGTWSSGGERFAGLVQREIVARTDLVDLRSHAKNWDLLRRTRMPAVRIDVGYLSNPGDAARLGDPAFRDVVAEAVVVAVQRMYLSPETDTRTGLLRLDELRAALQ